MIAERCFDLSAAQDLRLILVPKGAQRRSVESRGRILAASLQAFAEKGYDGVSTHEVSAMAGVTQGLITYHFKSKDGLWRATMDLLFADFRNSLADRIEELREVDARSFLRLIIKHIARWPTRHPFLIRYFVESGDHPDERLRWVLDRHVRIIYNVISHIFTVSMQIGIMRQLPVAQAYYVLMTAGSVFSLGEEIKLIAGADVKSEEFIDGQVECLLTMLIPD